MRPAARTPAMATKRTILGRSWRGERNVIVCEEAGVILAAVTATGAVPTVSARDASLVGAGANAGTSSGSWRSLGSRMNSAPGAVLASVSVSCSASDSLWAWLEASTGDAVSGDGAGAAGTADFSVGPAGVAVGVWSVSGISGTI